MPSLQLRIFCGAFSHIFETWKQTLKMCWLHRFLPKQLKHRWRDCLWKQTYRLGNICVFWHIQYGICFCLTRVSSSVSKKLLGITPSMVQSLPLTWAGTVLNCVCVCVCVDISVRGDQGPGSRGVGGGTQVTALRGSAVPFPPRISFHSWNHCVNRGGSILRSPFPTSCFPPW